MGRPSPPGWATAAAAALGVLLAGCGEQGQGGVRTLVHEPFDPPLPRLSFASPIPREAPRRIVSLVPSVTETLFALGLGDRVVAVDRWADHPPAVESLPRVGDLASVNTERILDLHPDLVILFPGSEDVGTLLRKAGLRVVIPETESRPLESLVAVADAVAVGARGRALAEHIESAVDAVRKRTAGSKPPRVLMAFERHPQISVATGTSFYQDLITAAGGVNVSQQAHQEKSWTYVSLETVIDWRPDVIIDLSVAPQGRRSRTEAAEFWSRVRVFRGSVTVHLVQAPVLGRPGPRLGAATAYIARLIHGK